MIWILLGIGGLYLWKNSQAAAVPQTGEEALKTNIKPAPYVPWSVSQSPAAATGDGTGTSETGVTNPLTAFLGRFKSLFPGPVSEMAPSGAGGATILPAASGAPAGDSLSGKLPSSPATYPEYGLNNPAIMADPKYWYMQLPIDVALIGGEDVSKAMSDPSQFDLAASYFDSSLGVEWSAL